MNLKQKYKSLNGKTRAIINNIFGAFTVKGLSLIISLFTFPAFIAYFGDRYVQGIWFTVLSVINWVLNFDLGIGNGLRNHLVAAFEQKDESKIKSYISSAYFAMGAVALLLTVAGLAVSAFIPWNSVFNVSADIISENIMLASVRYVFFGIMLQLFLRLISSVIYALQKSAVNNLIGLVTSVLQLIFVLVAPSTTPSENLLLMSKAYIILINAPLLAATVILFAGKLRRYIPSVKYIKRSRIRDVLGLGGIFFFCQILYMFIANTNEFFITQYTSPDNVVDYNIYYRLFSLAGTLVTLSLTPVWSAVTKAISENDFVWFKKTYSTLKKAGYLIVALELLIVPFLQPIINIWLRDEAIRVNYVYAFIFAAFGAVFVYQSVLSTVVCGIGKMKLQLCFYAVGLAVKFLIIHFGTMLTGSWIVVVFANAAILLPYCICQQLWLDKYVKTNYEKQLAGDSGQSS